MHKTPIQNNATTWVARIAVSIVFGWNILCAVQFITQPEVYASSYQLFGIAGNTALRGIGVTFLMWNATYPLFIINPRRWTYLGFIILVQQIIGLAGESFIYFTLISTHTTLLSQSILRFIVFDALGLIFIAGSLILLHITKEKL